MYTHLFVRGVVSDKVGTRIVNSSTSWSIWLGMSVQFFCLRLRLNKEDRKQGGAHIAVFVALNWNFPRF